jgi:hypothetical protein
MPDTAPRPRDVQELRIFRNARLIHRATVMRVVSARADIGFTQSEEVIATDVPCLASPSSASLVPRSGSEDEAVSSYTVEFDVLKDILPNHRLYVTGKMAGVEFAMRLGVVSINTPRAHGVALKVNATTSEALAGKGPPPA